MRHLLMTKYDYTHIVSVVKEGRHLGVDAGVVHRHEDRVGDDAERDEEIDEGVEDEEFDGVRERVPAG